MLRTLLDLFLLTLVWSFFLEADSNSTVTSLTKLNDLEFSRILKALNSKALTANELARLSEYTHKYSFQEHLYFESLLIQTGITQEDLGGDADEVPPGLELYKCIKLQLNNYNEVINEYNELIYETTVLSESVTQDSILDRAALTGVSLKTLVSSHRDIIKQFVILNRDVISFLNGIKQSTRALELAFPPIIEEESDTQLATRSSRRPKKKTYPAGVVEVSKR
ncbi:hypothetical protein DID80_05645 [Candidatus Marinamargulisbacteria bacterium SCGC AAA071-K20]|nr:hypothetical protein DID80_05645 [Candidatus Marinamargulisbacteria bacterium SCGC AAA071-K20]